MGHHRIIIIIPSTPRLRDAISIGELSAPRIGLNWYLHNLDTVHNIVMTIFGGGTFYRIIVYERIS